MPPLLSPHHGRGTHCVSVSIANSSECGTYPGRGQSSKARVLCEQGFHGNLDQVPKNLEALLCTSDRRQKALPLFSSASRGCIN